MSGGRSNGQAAIELETLNRGHAALLFEGLQDDELYKYLDGGPPPSVDRLEARYRRLESGVSPDRKENWLNWAIRARPSNDYLGYVQATVGKGGEARIAYVIFRRWWGQGYGRAAVAAMLETLRVDHGVRTATARVDERNVRSIRLLRALGFESSGRCANSARDVLFGRSLTPGLGGAPLRGRENRNG